MKKLLISGFVFFLLGGCCGALCNAQSGFIITERHQEFIVTDRDAEPVVVKEVTIENWKPKSTASDASEFYVAFYTADWCGYCRQVHASDEYQKIRSVYVINELDYDTTQAEWKRDVTHLPTFRLIRRSTNKTVKQWPAGAVTYDQIQAEVTRIRSTESGTAIKTTVSKSRNTPLFGISGTSHESRATLIHHLSSEGIHRGKWSVSELRGMSDEALDALHSKDHGWR